MKLFKSAQIRKALEYSKGGKQSLHVYTPAFFPKNVPPVFTKSKEWAHLFDQDKARLIETAKSLGVKKIYVHHENNQKQHIDLCGLPLKKAKLSC